MQQSHKRCPLAARFFMLGSLMAVASLQSFPAMGAPTSVDTEGQAQTVSTVPTNVRFTLLKEFQNQAVRDNTTGLVWEQSPRLEVYDWHWAAQQCLASTAGGRKGWRVPTVRELTSLVDASATDLKLPAGHPFSHVESAIYWSATRPADNAGYALFVNFSNGGSAALETYMSSFVWCVRSQND